MNLKEFLESVLKAGHTAPLASSARRLCAWQAPQTIKTLDGFDFAANSGVPKSQVQEMASLAFPERNESVVLLSPSCPGKTRIAMVLDYAATQAGIKVRFITTVDLLMIMTRAHRQNQ